MGITWAYSDKEVVGYEELLLRYPKKEFDSPFRSTIPHLLFWRSVETRFQEFCKVIGVQPSSSARLSFEFQVKPLYGRGNPSHTDLMLTWDNYCAAIEAKYLEPEYDTVEQWLEKGQRENRLMIVQGWCDLLARNTGLDVSVDSVRKITYQLLHRAASACTIPDRTPLLIYEVFVDEEPSPVMVEYPERIRELLNLLKPNLIQGFVLKIPIRSAPEYGELKAHWKNGHRQLHHNVLMGLRTGTLMSFGEPEVIEVK